MALPESRVGPERGTGNLPRVPCRISGQPSSARYPMSSKSSSRQEKQAYTSRMYPATGWDERLMLEQLLASVSSPEEAREGGP